MKNVHQSSIVHRVVSGAFELHRRVVKRGTGSSNLIQRANLRAHASKQLGNAERLRHKVVGARRGSAGTAVIPVAGVETITTDVVPALIVAETFEQLVAPVQPAGVDDQNVRRLVGQRLEQHALIRNRPERRTLVREAAKRRCWNDWTVFRDDDAGLTHRRAAPGDPPIRCCRR